MRTLEVENHDSELSHMTARALADKIANDNGELPFLLASYDREPDFESPAQAGECHRWL